MTKKKNILIGGLIAIVLIMSVGYAAFATKLTVNGTATVTSSWNIHFVKNTTAYISKTGIENGVEPEATMTFEDSAYIATVSATLHQPGDTIVYTFTIENSGSLNATLSEPTILTLNDDQFITYSVSKLENTELLSGKTTTFSLTVKYNDVKDEEGNSVNPTLNVDNNNDGVMDGYQIKTAVSFGAVQSVNQ